MTLAPPTNIDHLAVSPMLAATYTSDQAHSPAVVTTAQAARAGVRATAITPQRATTLPCPIVEPLTFAKVPVFVPSAPSSVAPCSSMLVSTDSEAFSDSNDHHSVLSRSPSLLTSLIQSQSRRSMSGSVSAGPSTCASPSALSPQATGNGSQYNSFSRASGISHSRPILRRASSGASGAEDSHRPSNASSKAHALALEAVLESVRERERDSSPARASVSRRRSCLKFAVTCPQKKPAADTTLSSVASSRRTPPKFASPRIASPVPDVATPEFDSESDDAGYQEDSEDGFEDSEEDDDDEDDDDECLTLAAQSRRAWCPMWSPFADAQPPAPILTTTPKRRQVSLVATHVQHDASTTDDNADVIEVVPINPARKIRIRIRDDEREVKSCTRHCSPPPAKILAGSCRPAPPAARSPSAAELCRRRSGADCTPRERREHSPSPLRKQGWRSDDSVLLALRGAPGAGATRRTRSPAPTRFVETSHLPSESDESRPALSRKPSEVALRRRSSAPVKIEQVHALATVTSTQCPVNGLKSVLRAASRAAAVA